MTYKLCTLLPATGNVERNQFKGKITFAYKG
jgi:hypothetical protein